MIQPGSNAISESSVEHVACDVCSQDNAESLFTGTDHELGGTERFPVVRCRACRLVYVSPRPGPDRIGSFYPQSYGPYLGRVPAWVDFAGYLVAKRQADRIGGSVAPGSRVLDVGCGIGRLLSVLHARGHQVAGVEPSEHARRMAQEKFGLELLPGNLQDAQFPAGAFDAVAMIHVLEHVPSPRRQLQEVHRILRPGGTLYLEIPNHECLETRIFGRYWAGWQLPRHYYHFAAETAGDLLGQTGFEVRWVNYPPVATFWAGSLAIVLAYQTGIDRGVPRWILAFRPVFKALFAPLSFLMTKLLRGRGGVMEIIATRK